MTNLKQRVVSATPQSVEGLRNQSWGWKGPKRFGMVPGLNGKIIGVVGRHVSDDETWGRIVLGFCLYYKVIPSSDMAPPSQLQ